MCTFHNLREVQVFVFGSGGMFPHPFASVWWYGFDLFIIPTCSRSCFSGAFSLLFWGGKTKI